MSAIGRAGRALRFEQRITTVGTALRQLHNTTIIVKLSDDINLGSLDTHMIGADVVQATGLNTIERKGTCIKVRTIQNLLAIDTYRPSAEAKLIALNYCTYPRCELSENQRARDESQVYEVWADTARPSLASFLVIGSPE
ncbi:hypothetical protein HPB47_004790 [Ixodes persulcatus]|uniref:Uncharacterized protein n=1 Tax=Ixodes persulcatus TaxID=34615 RepID=A0AC60PER0_IXOPE|nr:hypothetical protein HPB47_004790 [Ixodes persulcatus]